TVEGPPPPVGGRSLAASGRIAPPSHAEVFAEIDRLLALMAGPSTPPLLISGGPEGRPHNADDDARRLFLRDGLKARPGDGDDVEELPETTWAVRSPLPDPVARMGRWVRALQGHTQALIRTSEYRRHDSWEEA